MTSKKGDLGRVTWKPNIPIRQKKGTLDSVIPLKLDNIEVLSLFFHWTLSVEEMSFSLWDQMSNMQAAKRDNTQAAVMCFRYCFYTSHKAFHVVWYLDTRCEW